MSHSLREIAEQLRDANKKVQLIYAFNGSGKTRLSREFKELIAPKDADDEESEDRRVKVIYYNAFTEDLFYWDNDLEGDIERKLKIQPNAYTQWVLEEQGQDQNAIGHFQHYTNEKLTPRFNEEYIKKDNEGKDVTIPAFSEVTFSYERGDDTQDENVKISKGEESCFIWSIFFSLIEQVVEVLNVVEPGDRETDQFDSLKYLFIDDPVSSLDENHLIELAVNLASLIKKSYYAQNGSSGIRFIITTHNPLFYNVLHNELGKAEKYLLRKLEDETYLLESQANDSPFSYHLHLKDELKKAIESNSIRKYHYNHLRNILEKTSTFLGYGKWADLLLQVGGSETNPYETRMINLFSHSHHAGEEVAELRDDDKRMLGFLVQKLDDMYRLRMRNE
jgi:wobble nucleotide-excising tRNase